MHDISNLVEDIAKYIFLLNLDIRAPDSSESMNVFMFFILIC